MSMADLVTKQAIHEIIGRAFRETAADPRIKLSRADEEKIHDVLSEKLGGDPVAVNALGREHPMQSRVFLGSLTTSLGVIIYTGIGILRQFGVDVDESTAADIVHVVGAFITVAGVIYTVYGRFRKGLKPANWFGLFSKKG